MSTKSASAQTPSPSGHLPRHEHYAIFRDYLKHEDNLINNRISWNLAIQGFLFATYGFSLQKLAEVETRIIIERVSNPLQAFRTGTSFDQLMFLVKALPWVGFFVALLVWASVFAAKLAIEQLTTQWGNCEKGHPEPRLLLPDVIGGGVRAAHRLGFWAPLMIPAVFVVAWFVILMQLNGR